MWRTLLRVARNLTYLGLLGVLFALVAYVAFSQFVRRGVTPTPELAGLAEDQALALLADQGLHLSWSDSEQRYHEQVPKDHVLEQRPRAGTLVKRGSTVTAIASRGPQRIEVPAVAGVALQAAEVTLAAAGLQVGRTVSVFSDGDRDGVVVDQQPAAGDRVEPSAAVDLFLSLKSTAHTFLMPDLVGRDYQRVRRFFERRGFRFGRVGYRTYEGRTPGQILRHFPAAGHLLRAGDVISLTVVSPAHQESAAAGPEDAAAVSAGAAEG